MKYDRAGANEKINQCKSFFDSRIDQFFVNRYYLIDSDNTTIQTLLIPSDYGMDTIQKNKGEKMKSLNQIKSSGNGNVQKSTLSTITLAEKTKNAKLNSAPAPALSLKDRKNKSMNDTTSMNIQKIYEVEQLRKSIDSQGMLIADLITMVSEMNKTTYENNSLIALVAKDNKSTLNAINTLHAKLGNTPAINTPAPAINTPAPDTKLRKNTPAINTPAPDALQIVSVLNEKLSSENYQGLYEHFKSYFEHKFMKNSTCICLDEFSYFINGINFHSLQSVYDSTRTTWQAYRNDTTKMLFAPGSMIMAITALIKTGIDYEMINDYSPIIDTKKPDHALAINNEYAAPAPDTPAINTPAPAINTPAPVKDFNYWGSIFQVTKEIIAECIDLIKTEGNDEYNLATIAEHIKENSTMADTSALSFDSFNTYMTTTDFSTG